MADFESKQVAVGQTAVEIVSAANFTRTVVIALKNTSTAAVAVGYDDQVTLDNSYRIDSTPVQLYLPAGYPLWASLAGNTGTIDIKLIIGAA